MNDYRFVVRSHWRPWGKRWIFRLVAGNGEPVLQSEPYNSVGAALKGIGLVKVHAPDAVVTRLDLSK